MPRMGAVAVAASTLLVATLLTFPLSRFVVYSRDLFFVAAVIVVSRYAGVVLGLVVSFLSVLIFDWFFDSTPYILDWRVGGVARAMVFGSFSVLVASMEQQRRHAMERLEESNHTLQSALHEIKTLRGLLPICMYCKKIRTKEEKWVEVEEYVRKHTQAQFSHGLCPSCYRKNYPELWDGKSGQESQP
jgi:K+-sensing histidine kinase KdpD